MQSILLLAGAIIALSGLLTAFAGRVYGQRDLDRRIAFVEAHPVKWRLHNALFGMGSLVMAAGLALDAWWVAVPGIIGGLAGAAFALWRLLTPPATWFISDRGRLPFWTFTVATLLAFLAAGILHLPAAMGYGLVAYQCVLVVLTAWLRDLPPFLHFLSAIALALAVW